MMCNYCLTRLSSDDGTPCKSMDAAKDCPWMSPDDLAALTTAPAADRIAALEAQLREVSDAYHSAYLRLRERDEQIAKLNAEIIERQRIYHDTQWLQLEEAQERIAKAREALGPFVKAAEKADERTAEARLFMIDYTGKTQVGCGITFGDLRRAREVHAALATTPDACREAEERITQEYRWGNLTKLGVANHLQRAGFNQETAIAKAEALAK